MSAVKNEGAPLDRLLSRLDGVRETAPDQYAAKCPAHDDGSPSLSIRYLGSRVLIHCFAGCEPGDVMAAVGLSLSDLFDKPMDCGPIRKRDRWSKRGLFKQLMPEVDVVLIAANQVSEGKPLSAVDHRRLCDAHKHILSAWELVT